VTSTISFGNKQGGENGLRIFHPFFAQIMREQMRYPMQMERSEANKVL
jgi:hypothetical protein